MATYNGAKYLREQVDSILNQDLTKYPDAELELSLIHISEPTRRS